MREEDDGCCGGHHHHHDHQEDGAHEEDADEAMGQRPPMTFSMLVQSFAHQAMIGLGLVPWPDSGLVKIELNFAKESIDLLTMIKEKTKGNLTAEEQVMLDSLLYQLQVTFVDVSKSPAGNSPIIK
jgi:hypothetical protein